MPRGIGDFGTFRVQETEHLGPVLGSTRCARVVACHMCRPRPNFARIPGNRWHFAAELRRGTVPRFEPEVIRGCIRVARAFPVKLSHEAREVLFGFGNRCTRLVLVLRRLPDRGAVPDRGQRLDLLAGRTVLHGSVVQDGVGAWGCSSCSDTSARCSRPISQWRGRASSGPRSTRRCPRPPRCSAWHLGVVLLYGGTVVGDRLGRGRAESWLA